MKKDKAYEELNKKLNSYLENSVNDVQIDEQAKDKIWKNISMEVHEKEMKRKYRTRRTFKVAVTVCVVIIALVSVDLSSNASLFRRLLTSVSGNTIQSITRDSKIDNKTRRDKDLDEKVKKINDEGGYNFISPALVDTYNVEDVVQNGSNLMIYLSGDNDNYIEISQKYIGDGNSSAMVKYNDKLFGINVYNNEGIEYRLVENNDLIIGIFVIDDIELEIVGEKYMDVVETVVSLQNKYIDDSK
ncbi:hypothetical protein SH1V18_06630 [Vallitalea longa]|uniref:DUF4367 domain-containing protein n=1 Tax=Vallitalea longa TaxID=2936439 RepID=A0A9W5YBE9_9FIRM|nr:hypothetical protein [Vallitalea longa]GKX28183.1 hypothetical protein SH1V18_06630 [Vallitalea longa]